MAFITRASSMALALAGVWLSGCAGDGADNFFTTGAIGSPGQSAEAKVDPVCTNLAGRIDALRREGIADKIERASLKKYKMTQADLAKADQLTKADAEFQARCSTLGTRPTTAMVSSTPATIAPAGKTSAKAPN
jgi:hypothetical protein